MFEEDADPSASGGTGVKSAANMVIVLPITWMLTLRMPTDVIERSANPSNWKAAAL